MKLRGLKVVVPGSEILSSLFSMAEFISPQDSGCECINACVWKRDKGKEGLEH